MKPDNHNSENRLWLLLARKMADEATQDELIELEALVQKNPNAHYAIEILSLWWRFAEESGIEEADKAVMNLLQQIEKENKISQTNKKDNTNYFVLA
jgi:hypothetical protein